MLAALTLLSSSFLAPPPVELAARRQRLDVPVVCLFGGKWPWDSNQGAGSEEGKFVRHSELEPGCAPLGLVVAGFDEDQLETLASTVEGVLEDPDGGTAHVPIVVLDSTDLRLRLRDVLSDVSARDSVLPDRPAQPRIPLVLLSGFSPVAVSATVRALRALSLQGGSGRQRPMFAAAVPNALNKPLSVLLDEMEGDHTANTERNEG
jgi:hypothetical protein